MYPLAVKTLKRDIEQYFTYYDFAPDLRKSIKSTNPLERQTKRKSEDMPVKTESQHSEELAYV